MSSPKKMIVLESSDGESFEVDEATALLSQTISHLVEDGCAGNKVPLANVPGKTLAKVIEYCKEHAAAAETTADDAETTPTSASVEKLKKFDSDFVNVDQSTIFELILAANYLNIPSLLDLTSQTVADMIAACKNAEEVRKKFGIENDFTPEEEEQVRKENEWAFE